MKNIELENKYAQFCSLIIDNKLVDAFNVFEKFIELDKNEENKIKFNKIKETYFLMLKYSTYYAKDPQRSKIYDSLILQLFNLADVVKEDIYTQDNKMVIYSEKRKINKYSISTFNKINKLLLAKEKEDETIVYSNEINELFKIIWFTDKYTKIETEKILEFFNFENFEWHQKCLIVSALTLSLIRCFDIEKIQLLFDIIKLEKTQIFERAFIGLIVSLYIYDDRLKLYPEVYDNLQEISYTTDFDKNIESILIQLVKTKETEEIANKLKNEIIPEMMKISPKMNEKLDLDKIISDSLIEDKNPDWEELFEDSPQILNQMQELSELQLDGSDVLMGTFGMLKFFPFFHNIYNWFAPYYPEKDEIKILVEKSDDKELFKSVTYGLGKSSYMCNSDKYSFFFNIENMPPPQKNMIINLFKMESEAIDEIKKDEKLLHRNFESKEIITQYIQDLYRFFKLNNQKAEFKDIFNLKLDIYNSTFFNKVVTDTETIRNLAELYFKKNYFAESIEVYQLLTKKGESRVDIFEKIAYSYQRLLNYGKALEFYHKAEFFDINTLWIIKKIAFCHIKMNNYTKALEYYKKVEIEEPQDLLTQTNIGHCYLNLGDHENALKHYFKVEYYSPSNIKILRPIAWCSFILNKLDAAKRNYEKLIAKEATNYDYMNLGHIFWCEGDKLTAIKYYKKSIEKSEKIDEFVKDFSDDTKHLLAKGVDEFDIKLMIDYLKVADKIELI